MVGGSNPLAPTFSLLSLLGGIQPRQTVQNPAQAKNSGFRTAAISSTFSFNYADIGWGINSGSPGRRDLILAPGLI